MTTGLLALYSGFVASPSATSAVSTAKTVDIESQFAQTIDTSNREEVEKYVRDYYSETPILAEVARCESTFRQTGISGNVIRGLINSKDVGAMQINETYHKKSANALGYDLHDLDGNLAYATHLYKQYGLSPWNSSSKCWKATEAYKAYGKEIAKK